MSCHEHPLPKLSCWATPKFLNFLLWLLLVSLANPLQVFRRFIQQYRRTQFPHSTPWRNKQKMTSHVRSHYSQAYKVITPFCMTRFANWKLAPTIQSFGGYHRYDSSSFQQNQHIASLNLLMMRLPVTGVLFSELIPMATKSSSNFTLMELVLQPDNLQHSSSTFFPGDYDGLLRWPFRKVIHLSLRDQLDSLNAWTQTIQPTKEPFFRRRTSSPKNEAFAVTFTNTSHILKFSAKLTDTL